MSKRFETVTFTAPSAWACYLINGDASSLDDSEQAEADAFIEDVHARYPGTYWPVNCEDAGFIGNPDYGCAGDCQEYTFMWEVKQS